MLVGYVLVALGGSLLGTIAVVLQLWWPDSEHRSHVLAISVSYLILVALSMQPSLRLALVPAAHSALAIIAYLIGGWALLQLVRTKLARRKVEARVEADR